MEPRGKYFLMTKRPEERINQLKIGIDGRCLQGNKRGDGWYIFEICRRLDRILPLVSFYIYSAIPVEMPVKSMRWNLRCDRGALRHIPPLLWLKTRGSLMIRRDRINIFWGTNLFLPWLEKKVRTVLTVHDLAPLMYPADYEWLHRVANLLFLKKDITAANQLVAVSRGTAERLSQWLGRKAVVVPPALREHFRRPEPHLISSCLRRYAIEPPYLLTVATWEPRKNLITLFKAFKSLKERGYLPGFKLVLCGNLKYNYRQLQGALRAEQDGTVKYLGYVPDEDLPMLYAGARLLVFPSKYEGFGMPVIEARACGTRVVTTDIPELREAGGDTTIYTRLETISLIAGIQKGLALPEPPREDVFISNWEDSALKMAAIFAQNE